jgi:hypothetical protein
MTIPSCAHTTIRQAAKRERRQQEAVANELLDGIEDFANADSINLFLGNLVKQLARQRIGRRDAVALAYVSQLLLNSLTALEVNRLRKKSFAGRSLSSDMKQARSCVLQALKAHTAISPRRKPRRRPEPAGSTARNAESRRWRSSSSWHSGERAGPFPARDLRGTISPARSGRRL